MTDHVIDSSIVLAMLKGEPGAADAARLVADALVSAVNHAEIISKLTEWNRSEAAEPEAARVLGYRIADFTADLARQTGLLRAGTKSLGLSLGDRACLALAMRERLPVWTTDRRWAKLKIGVEIVVLR